jgi:EAL domain-containing protein (putative c-di-GMP-specific phosphodiesterase class I)
MDLRQAIAGQQFLLYYQAQVNEQYVITGVEVLVRWRHPERGMVSPADFIPLAEETGLILPIGNWVLESACEQLALWAQQSELAHLSLAINVSARQFRESSFVAQVLAALERTGANPQRLKLELTESILLADVADVINKMSILKTKGIGFAIDDFGTGYSSLAYLKQLPIEKLKIDQSFVRNILIASNEVAITKAIIAMADSLGLSVIAEGVETRAQSELLASLGCHNYQGYLFSRPVPVAEFELLARRGCSVLLASE